MRFSKKGFSFLFGRIHSNTQEKDNFKKQLIIPELYKYACVCKFRDSEKKKFLLFSYDYAIPVRISVRVILYYITEKFTGNDYPDGGAICSRDRQQPVCARTRKRNTRRSLL